MAVRIKTARDSLCAVKSQTLACGDLAILVCADDAGKHAFPRALLAFQSRQEAGVGFCVIRMDMDVGITAALADLLGVVAKRSPRRFRHGRLKTTSVYRCGNSNGAGAAHPPHPQPDARRS